MKRVVKMKEKDFDIFETKLVPKHELINDEEKASLLKEFNIKITQLPRISIDDPVSKRIEAKKGDVVRIFRKDTNSTIYYRVVV